jgi:CobQ-like glutamine amidotransferase family enzyme
MTLRIAHLYGDLMNIYGDWGNILTLIYRAKQRQIAVEVQTVSVGYELKPGSFDLYFFGGGQDAGQEIVAPDLQRIAQTLKNDIDDGVALLSICGGYQLLGHSYKTAEGVELPGAGVLPVTTESGPQRMMQNVTVALNPQLDIERSHSATLVGFENHSGRTRLLENAIALGRVIRGDGNNGEDGTEGVVMRHAVGSYLHGSCLPKNPHLADWLLTKALSRRYREVDLQPLDDSLEWHAHHRAALLKA